MQIIEKKNIQLFDQKQEYIFNEFSGIGFLMLNKNTLEVEEAIKLGFSKDDIFSITGKSLSPITLEINDEEIEIHTAYFLEIKFNYLLSIS